MIPLQQVLMLSFTLVLIATVGLCIRRDALTLFLCVELILNAANISFVGFARHVGNVQGHVAVLLIIALAAAEAAVGLALVIRLKKTGQPLLVEELTELKN